MACCARCFADRWIKQHIRQHSTDIGDCRFCGTRNVPVLRIGLLAPYFGPMMTLYNELTSDTILDFEDPLSVGGILLDLIQDDWNVFSAQLIASGRGGTLLQRLANYDWDDDDGENPFDASELYTRRRSWSHETLEQALDAVIADIRDDSHHHDVPAKLAEALGENLTTLARRVRKGMLLYRGRPGYQPTGEPHAGPQIGAPPIGAASAGRANRGGVSVLYTALDEQTATAELRARVPQGLLSMCRVRTRRDLKVIDVVKGYPRVNPFTSTGEKLYWVVEVADLLVHFGSELSQPVQSDDDPQEYRITQQLCEAVSAAGYDGIMYRSTRHSRGVNLVVFDPGLCDIQPSWLVQ